MVSVRDGVKFAPFDVVVYGNGGFLRPVLRIVCVAAVEGF